MEYGLIGEHLGHSYSKLIQEKLLDNYTYEIQEVSKEDLDSFMKKREFKAINVTIPYKQAVIPYLEEAIMKMELLGHDFFIYIDDETKKIAVVYKRNLGGYGLIETE